MLLIENVLLVDIRIKEVKKNYGCIHRVIAQFNNKHYLDSIIWMKLEGQPNN